jgi:hypothetical protein
MVRHAKHARLPLALACGLLFALSSAAPLLADSVIGSGGQPQPLYPINGQAGSTPPPTPPPTSAGHGSGGNSGRVPPSRHSGRPGGTRDLHAGSASTGTSEAGSAVSTNEPSGANGGSARATGVVQSVSERGIVLRELDGTTVAVAVGDGTAVTIDGAPAGLAEVHPGYVVVVEWAADGSAASLAFVRSG